MRQRLNGVESLLRATVDTPAGPADSARGAAAALTSSLARRAGLTMILFRDAQGGSDTLAAILTEVSRAFASGHPPIQIDVRDHPAVAAAYDVRTTPTILLVKNGKVVDRVIGTPTRILLENLLDARTPGTRS
jgi:Thioredoxin